MKILVEVAMCQVIEVEIPEGLPDNEAREVATRAFDNTFIRPPEDSGIDIMYATFFKSPKNESEGIGPEDEWFDVDF